MANAYVKPLMTQLVGRIEAALRAQHFDCPVLMMTSAGGMTSVEAALRFPIRLLKSGPSGGAVLAARIAQLANEPAALSFDMGGTTAKCASSNRAIRTEPASWRWRGRRA